MNVFKNSIIRAGKLFHYLFSIGLFALTLYLFYDNMYPVETDLKRFLLVVAVYAVFSMFLCRAYSAYDVEFSSPNTLGFSLSLTHVIGGGFMYVVLVLDFWNFKFVNLLPMAGMVAVQIIFTFIWSHIISCAYHKLNKADKTLLICGEEHDVESLNEVYKFKKHFEIEKVIVNPCEDIESIIPEIHNFEAVFVSGVSATFRNGIIKECIEHNISCYVAPHVGDIILGGAEHIEQFSNPIFFASRKQINIEYAISKRGLDIIFSLLGIIVTSPLMAATAIAVRLYDKGPALYKQVRLTKDGKEFKIFKFRSMRTNAESDGVARLATSNDDRITPVGKFIRAVRLDELPQLFNILKGDMSFVGPRPERPEIAAQYTQELHSFPLRLQVRAGLTGLAQVYGKYNTNPYDKLKMDLMYINKMSFVKDLKLILATIRILFVKESTSGIAQGKITASVQHKEAKETVSE